MTSEHSPEDLLRITLALVATRPLAGAWPEELHSLERLSEILPGTEDATATDIADVRALRDRLAPLVLSPDPDAAPVELSALAEEFGLRPAVDSVGGPIRHVSPDPRPVARAAEVLVPGVMLAWAAGLTSRVRVCGADGCETPFLDSSHRANRHYCSPRCSTRMRVRRHRERPPGAA
ncbi:CGNR zinc finger domain-containing protein [Nocardiopsis lambiniae]|uniref:CGNR zinc finger domain-containing protein n=1 Tax=Nocardiopsis lambiniae TaxID=3075539 RepID=A0ABU2MF16_9ACTN|nr:CGNR zinc finger domain-containing protein [Nocardiopsis sp. DSM 44743]MDT0330836.1 CGNR zinc finger domain-containing protein [Nocardiopsis sp. DSM 44743]